MPVQPSARYDLTLLDGSSLSVEVPLGFKAVEIRGEGPRAADHHSKTSKRVSRPVMEKV